MHAGEKAYGCKIFNISFSYPMVLKDTLKMNMTERYNFVSKFVLFSRLGAHLDFVLTIWGWNIETYFYC